MSLSDCLQVLSSASIGIFAGAMLTEAFVLVPYWRSLPPEGFFAWYEANGRRLLSFFGAVTVAAALASLLAAIVGFSSGDDGRWPALASTLIVLLSVALFFAVFETRNREFADASIPAAELPGRLAAWNAWHLARTAMIVAALFVSLAAI